MIARQRHKPFHIRCALLSLAGLTNKEIALEVSKSPETISAVLASAEVQAFLAEYRGQALNSMLEVQTMAQAIAPVAMHEKIRLALNGRDERVRNTACKELLEIAGHTPLHRVSVDRPDHVSEKYAERSDEDIRREIEQALGVGASSADPTLH